MTIENAQLVSSVFLITLLVWSVAWIIVSAVKLKSGSTKSYWWKTHMLWCSVNAIIATVSLVSLFSRDSFDAEYVTSQRTIVLVNVFLDVVYAVIAIIFLRKKTDTYTQIGKAVLIQAAFLFVLDIVIVIGLTTLL